MWPVTQRLLRVRVDLNYYPVSATGQCLMDLIDTRPDPGHLKKLQSYSSRQILLLREFTKLLEQADEFF